MIGQLKWNTTGIARRALHTLDDLVGFAQEVRTFSAGVSEYLRRLSLEPFVQTRPLTGLIMDGTTNPNYFPHGLGKPYEGAVITSATLSTRLRILPPDEVVAAGQDVTQVFGIQSGTAVAAIVNCRVF